jgi:hypothetical protein
MEACYGGPDVMERSCAVAREIDINTSLLTYNILYPLQHVPPARSPLCPMRLVCTVTA